MRGLWIGLWVGWGCAGAVDGDDVVPDPPTETDAAVCDPAVVGTWETVGEAYVRTWCTPCHAASLTGDARGGAPAGVDFDGWEDVRRWAEAIASAAVGSGDEAPRMPPGGGPRPADVAAFAAWLACDAPGTPATPDPCAVAKLSAGDRTLTSEADVADFCATANTVGGQLVLATDAPVDCLCDVYGDLSFAEGATEVQAARLRGIGGALRVEASTVQSIALPALRTVSGGVDLRGAPALTALELPQLRDVAGDVWVDGETGLTVLALPELATVGGSIRIVDAGTLVTVAMPRLLTVAGGLTLSGLSAWSSWTDFASLTDVGGDLIVIGNPSVGALTGFDQLGSVGGDVVLADLGGLSSIAGFNDLETVGGSVRIVDDPQLRGVDGFLRLATVGKAVEVARNPQLVAVDGFGALTRVGVEGDWVFGDHRLAFTDLPAVTRLPRFGALTRVGGLEILRADVLDALEFPALVVVDRQLAVVQVGGLRTLAGLGAVRRIGTDLAITGNPSLPTAAVDAFLDGVGASNIGGVVTVQNNGP